MEKNYAFEIPDVPNQCEYLQIQYSVSKRLPPSTPSLKAGTVWFDVFLCVLSIEGRVSSSAARPEGGDLLPHFWNEHLQSGALSPQQEN